MVLVAGLLGSLELVHERAGRLADRLLERCRRGCVGPRGVELHRVDLAQWHERLAVGVEQVAALALGAGCGEPVARRELRVPVGARRRGLHGPAVSGLADAHGCPVSPRDRPGQGPRHLGAPRRRSSHCGGASPRRRGPVPTLAPRSRSRSSRRPRPTRCREAQLGLVERAALPGVSERLHGRLGLVVTFALLRGVSPPEPGSHRRHEQKPRSDRCYRAFPHGPIQQHVSAEPTDVGSSQGGYGASEEWDDDRPTFLGWPSTLPGAHCASVAADGRC